MAWHFRLHSGLEWSGLGAPPGKPRGIPAPHASPKHIFQDEIRLEGGMIHTGPSMILGQPPGGFSFVISQPWLEAADNKHQFPSEEEIHGLLSEIGFQPMLKSLYGWQNTDQSLIILDAKPDNFIVTADGILPIDLLITECQAAA